MTITPLPSYGIWTTDIDGKRVMGFTPDQFLTVWQARADLEAQLETLGKVNRKLVEDYADLEAENAKLWEALKQAVNNPYRSGTDSYERVMDEARAALEGTK